MSSAPRPPARGLPPSPVDGGRLWGHAVRRIGLEAGLIAAALLGAAWALQALPLAPADRSAAWRASAGVVQLAGELWPARRGVNRLTLYVSEPSGAPLGDAEVEVTFLPVGGGGVVARRTLAATAGAYVAGDIALGRPGPWQMLAAVRRPGEPPAYASVDWVVGPEGGVWLAAEPRPLEAEVLGWVNGAATPGLGILAIAGLAAWAGLAWRRWRLINQVN